MRFRPVPQALAQIRNDLDRVIVQNKPPLLDLQTMLGLLRLDGSKPDGKSLARRFLHSDTILDIIPPIVLPPVGESKQAIEQMFAFIDRLLSLLAENYESNYQYAEAKTLIAVAERQIVREKKICPIATGLYLEIGSNRPEMVSGSVYKRLTSQVSHEKALKRPFGFLRRIYTAH